MEWNFVFRIDYLRQHGEERNLKGLIFTDGERPPTADQIEQFLRGSGYRGAQIKDPERLIFFDPNGDDPVEIRIVRLGNEERREDDRILRKLIDHLRKH
ncbi:hypothetical protein IDH44_21885 [Paenibacillus sp. IB182496]|uniref:Uncharacterized protein n=1 Tax=Paenibacillus sabuli TaxID=2772509 RepID=A0A927BYP8_9BACL|nr:hypothetical protein [Paenibacillus sabuli]MBD2847854.1 hypothetical protein [Paenibacillus sabuli]